MSKLSITPDELRRIPPHYLSWVELSDGQFQNMDDPIDETINHRRLPGEGEFDIPAYVEVLREVGYEGPWGVEVLSAQLRSCRSRRSSSEPTRRRPRSSARRERSDEDRQPSLTATG